MASRVPDENPCNTADTEDETAARQRKRSRRVSFADEMTSVHVYKRDEEYESPQDSDSRPISEREKDVLNLFSDLVDDGDANGEDDLDGSSSFLRPLHSPSPGGSSTLCSAASSDEENFFGPVSADFIRPGRLFDSATSDENHDVTMDSTAFSMHFRSLLRSDSGDVFKTPTMEEIIPQVNTPHRENLMALTREKHLMSQTPDPLINKSEGKDSDMSLVGENSERYNYEKLSPALEALLADSGEDVPAVPVCDSVEPQLLEGREVSLVHSSKVGHKEVKNYDDSKLVNLDNQKSSAVGVSVTLEEPCEPSAKTFVNETIHVNQPLIHNDAFSDASAGDQIHCLPQGDLTSAVVLSTGTSMLISDGCTPLDSRPGSHQLYLFKQFKDGIRPPAEEDVEDKSLKERNCHDEACISPSSGSISSLSIKRQQLLINVTNSSRRAKFTTPSSTSIASFSGKRGANVSGGVPPILSSSRNLKLFELSPQSPIVDVQTQSLKDVLPNSLTSKALPLSFQMKESLKTLPSRHNDVRKMNLDKVLFDSDQEGQIDSISYLRNGVHVDLNNLFENKEAGRAPNDTGRVQLICSGTMMASSSKTIPSEENEILDRVGLVPFASGPESSAMHLEVDSYTSTGKGIISHKLPKSLDVEVLSHSKYQRSPLQNLMQLESDKTCLAGEIGELADLQRVIVHECSPCETPTRMISALSLAAQKSNQNHNKKLQQNVSSGNDSQLIPTSSSSSDTQPIANHNLASNVSHNMGHLEEISTSSYRKRTSDRLSVGHSDHLDETSRIRQSPKVLKVLENHSSLTLEYSDANRKQKEKKKAESGKARMNLTEVFNKLSADTDHMPASIDRMNIRLIDQLGDILVHRQKVCATKAICSDIHFWASDQSSDFNYKRGADARSFLSKIVYEKSKLQLLRMKRNFLQERLELLRAKLQQSLLLKSNCLAIRSSSGPEEARIKQLSFVASTENEVVTDKVKRMKSEVEVLEKKINSLLNSLHFSLKLKGDPNLPDSIVLLNNQLKKRTCYRMIHNDIQLWEIDDLVNTNGHQEIVLTYLGFISQRITVTGSTISSIVLNDVNIMKSFPNMEAFFAFAFVFDSGFIKKFVGPGNMAHETQRTGLLLSNLLDVVEELRLARIEIRNLVQTTFHSPSAGQLGLQLIFRDLISCDKLTVDLDLSCLKWGVYPTDVQPSRIQHSRIRSEKSQLTDEISVAVDNLKVGFWRIIRICRCISRMLESLGK